ncbi:MAG TPA: response regulator [Ideonella sp.]|uniref:response regulator n=1 Tax=Ideonella sp. TaxID=1929293 RepID=UPI002C8A50FE|nr:response regulator [Ideonella sp.]HSI49586.1 response regulator [Ideonella sp.]
MNPSEFLAVAGVFFQGTLALLFLSLARQSQKREARHVAAGFGLWALVQLAMVFGLAGSPPGLLAAASWMPVAVLGIAALGSRLLRAHRQLGWQLAQQRSVAEQAMARARASEARQAELTQQLQQRQAQWQEAHQALAEAREQAQAATRAKSEFLANMSHEIRTPMNAMQGLINLTLRSRLDSRQRGYLNQARAAADTLLLIINDILDFSKIEAGKLALEHRPFLLVQVLDKLQAAIGASAQDKGLALKMDVPEDLPPVLVGDALRLEQVLVNLCANAVKFTARGEVRVAVRCTQQDSSSEVPTCTLVFAVHDTGVGIQPAQAERLFQPFDQLDPSSTRQHGGTGLGLAICKQLVTLMGGKIGVQSKPGEGSEFSFDARLQVGTAEHASMLVQQREAAAASQSTDPAAVPAMLRGKRVLLVEDNESNQIVAGDLLREYAGMEVQLARDGKEALACLRDQHFDLVLMDVQMPVMDGYQATALIRREARHQTLPIIAMTAHALPSDRHKSLAVGMNDYVTKPFDPAQLFQVLVRWLAPRPVPANTPAVRPPPALPGAAAASPRASSTALPPDGDNTEEAVSFALGLQRCLSQRDLYRKVVQRFVSVHAEQPAQLAAALARAAWREAAALAHDLISTAGTIGAEGLSQTARALEQAANAGESARCEALQATLAVQHARVMQALARYLDDQAAPHR